MTSFSKNCLVFTALATSLISSRVAAQEVSPSISLLPVVAKVDSPMVGAIPALDSLVSLDLSTKSPISGINPTNPWFRIIAFWLERIFFIGDRCRYFGIKFPFVKFPGFGNKFLG